MRVVFVALILLGCSGCATVVSTAFEGPSLYAGTRHDLWDMSQFATKGVKNESRWVRPTNFALRACDLPFSAVADTVVLPFYVGSVIKNRLDYAVP